MRKNRSKQKSEIRNKARITSHSEIYSRVYRDVLNSGAIGVVNMIFHRAMESEFKGNQTFERVLEVGAGDGIHRKFVKHNYTQYWQSDILYPEEDARGLRELESKKYREIHLDAEDLRDLQDDSFNRLIATCVLIHIKDMEKALSEWRRVVADGGIITIYVPSEPGMLLNLAQYFTTRRKFEKYGVDYYSWQYQEHIHHFPHAKVLVGKVFASDRIALKKFPLNLLPWHLTLWGVWQIQINKSEID